MTPEETQALIDHLDESIKGKPSGTLEQLLAEDAETAQEWYYLNTAIDAVKHAALYAEVSSVKEELISEQDIQPNGRTIQTQGSVSDKAPAIRPSGAVIRKINRYGLRIAACTLLIIASSAIYKYVSVSSSSLYGRYFVSYELNTARGDFSENAIQKAFNAKDWTVVLARASDAKEKDNQTEFLAGMADLELGKNADAVAHFEQVIAANSQAKTDYYQDEAEYYLAISWLACDKVNRAMPILEKIKADPHHQYHEKVTKMSFFDLRLAQYKENK
jgi:tetratricopeptide (TPR) repeat protein